MKYNLQTKVSAALGINVNTLNRPLIVLLE